MPTAPSCLWPPLFPIPRIPPSLTWVPQIRLAFCHHKKVSSALLIKFSLTWVPQSRLTLFMFIFDYFLVLFFLNKFLFLSTFLSDFTFLCAFWISFWVKYLLNCIFWVFFWVTLLFFSTFWVILLIVILFGVELHFWVIFLVFYLYFWSLRTYMIKAADLAEKTLLFTIHPLDGQKISVT